ncbi:site-specific integrase [Kineosporia sp. R_H_3]|uniref:tyrosine-type recombinase/integrase n=1 Tax=Kineosporia sp. R_H_3 TaxID=1961848 RepID=UPI000B4B2C54|nr:site-specific integrase [Kineosporia sp. R_H_3]
MSKPRGRANGEGSIYARAAGGYAAYVWVTTPTGKRIRKYVYGASREDVHTKWLALHQRAAQAPVATKLPSLGAYLNGWLLEVITPNCAPATIANYRMFIKHYIAPALGERRIDKLLPRDVQRWLNGLKTACQCCAQGKDARRPAPKCCAKNQCCQQVASARTIHTAWTVLRSGLSNAVRDELVTRNVASLVRLPQARPKKAKPWTVDEARRFLEAAFEAGDPHYAAYVLMLVLGLRRGELLALKWQDVDLDVGTVWIGWQLQRVDGRLLRRQTKTEASDALLPLPPICTTALTVWRARQANRRAQAGLAWHDLDFVFTTRHGLPVEPRNFHRDFKRRAALAGVPIIAVHTTRRTCASLLVALDVHPRVAMQILRHSQIAVTMNIYSEATSDTTQAALLALGEHLGRHI